jgi:hypothetical protein
MTWATLKSGVLRWLGRLVEWLFEDLLHGGCVMTMATVAAVIWAWPKVRQHPLLTVTIILGVALLVAIAWNVHGAHQQDREARRALRAAQRAAEAERRVRAAQRSSPS